jgi:hypothetical protein
LSSYKITENNQERAKEILRGSKDKYEEGLMEEEIELEEVREQMLGDLIIMIVLPYILFKFMTGTL